MRRDDPSEAFRVEFDTHNCDLSPEQMAVMQGDLDTLTKLVANFPKPELHVFVERESRTNEFVVKTSLLLPGQTLVASDHDQFVRTAYENCVDVLMAQLKEYKDRLGQVPERQKTVEGTRNRLEPTIDPDPAAVDAAVAAGDYAAFRTALQGYEEALRDRVGRWIERTPAVGLIGRSLTIADVVEEVFLDAFDGYDRRAKDVRFGDWLESLIDPAVKDLLRDGDGARENISMARTLQGVPATREEK